MSNSEEFVAAKKTLNPAKPVVFTLEKKNSDPPVDKDDDNSKGTVAVKHAQDTAQELPASYSHSKLKKTYVNRNFYLAPEHLFLCCNRKAAG